MMNVERVERIAKDLNGYFISKKDFLEVMNSMKVAIQSIQGIVELQNARIENQQKAIEEMAKKLGY